MRSCTPGVEVRTTVHLLPAQAIEMSASAARPRTPFDDVMPGIGVAVVWASIGMFWLIAGSNLPGGRWLAVHLFTLGVVTNFVLAFSYHFAMTLTHQPARLVGILVIVVTNIGIAVTVTAMAMEWERVVGIGASTVILGIVVNWWGLRRLRARGIGARFSWVVRSYERAHEAVVLGAVLGGLMGAGVLVGAWYASARLAHVHVNLLGWAGMTVLATLVFFGPTMARARIEDGADARAARALPRAAAAITVATVALLLTALDGVAGDVARILAAVSLGVSAWEVVDTTRGVTAAARQGAAPGRHAVIATCAWFALVVSADALVVATGTWELLDILGVGLLVGVLAQAITATLHYLSPMFADRSRRAAMRDALEHRAVARTIAFNAGVAMIVVPELLATLVPVFNGLTVVTGLGWAFVVVALVEPLTLVARA